MKGSLAPMFSPSSIALVGASANPGKIGNAVLKNLSAGGFEVYPVNPRETEILGLRCYASVRDIPGAVDLGMVVLPAKAAVEATRECAEKGVKVVIVTSSGFAETGEEGAAMERELRKVAEDHGVRVLGPNTMGLLVPGKRLDTFFVSQDRSSRPGPGRIALLSQSGAVAVSTLEKLESAGAGISACVCLGNKCDIEEVELLEHLAKDSDTDCIALYLESFSDGRRFVEAASRVTRTKPIVLLKSGRTASGSRAARSHTGAIASASDSLVDGALRQAGVVRVYDEEELVDVARALSAFGHADGDRVCVVASAGGFGVIASDYVESEEHGFGLRMAELSDVTKDALRRAMPEFATPQNPVDLTAGVTDRMYDDVLRTIQRDEGVDAVMMSLELQPPNVTQGLVDVAARRVQAGGPPILISLFARNQSAVIRGMEHQGLVAYPTIKRTLRAIASLVERGSYLKRKA